MNKIERIIDANQNRCVEGLRVLEEYCRFVKNDKAMAAEIRLMRHFIRKSLGQAWIGHRDSANDVGVSTSKASTVDEKGSLAQLLRANASRVAESLRVLEEYLKVLGQYDLSKGIEAKRFSFYSIEKSLVGDYMVSGLYVLTSDGDEASIMKQVEMFIASGVKWVQYRDKTREYEEVLRIACKITQLAKGTNTKIIINDYIDIAVQCGAHGVHVGQGDRSVLEVRQLAPELLVGVSTHNKDQFDKAVKMSPDYIAMGPIFETTTKVNPEACDGLSFAEYGRKATMIPLVAIGGINKDTIEEVKAIGIDSIAMSASVRTQDGLLLMKSMIN